MPDQIIYETCGRAGWNGIKLSKYYFSINPKRIFQIECYGHCGEPIVKTNLALHKRICCITHLVFNVKWDNHRRSCCLVEANVLCLMFRDFSQRFFVRSIDGEARHHESCQRERFISAFSKLVWKLRENRGCTQTFAKSNLCQLSHATPSTSVNQTNLLWRISREISLQSTTLFASLHQT